ncbi:MAG: complex I subunit 5 family protein [Bdellovibrionia bacterium]
MDNPNLLLPLQIAIPLLMAAILTGAGQWFPRKITDLLSMATALVSSWIGLRLIEHTGPGQKPLIYWFGGWGPGVMSSRALGVSFSVDPISAILATFVPFLFVFTFIYTWRYFKEVKSLFHALMLVFMASMCGFCLSGDLFNLFVWFELMSAAGIVLCGYKSEELGPLQGAINFAVLNSVGAFLTLTGIAFLYAHTSALNMAQMGASLAQTSPDPWVWIAFAFVCFGFLTKAAIVPFHFWLADAHAVAPAPVSALFSGIMVPLGLFAVQKVHHTVFAQAFAPQQHQIQQVFIWMGVASTLLGGVMCFLQRHLKRLLAFSTISHVGMMMIALSLFQEQASHGMYTYLLGHGLVKASLFMIVGILLHRTGSVDEKKLFRKCLELKPANILFLTATLGIAGVPPFSTFSGHHEIEKALRETHQEWLGYVLILGSALTAGTLFRSYARIFLGWGRSTQDNFSSPQPAEGDENRETGETPSQTPWSMILAPALLLAFSVALSFESRFKVDARSLIHAGLTLFLALALATSALYGKRGLIKSRSPHAILLRSMASGLHSLHSGQVGDYIVWFTLGVGVYGLGFLLKT